MNCLFTGEPTAILAQDATAVAEENAKALPKLIVTRDLAITFEPIA